MLTAIDNPSLVFFNPSQISEIKAVGFTKSEIYTYQKGSLLRRKGIYTFGLYTYNKIEKFLEENNNFIVEDNIVYEKPYILIRLQNNKKYTWHYESLDNMNEALQVFLDDLRTIGNSAIRINRKVENGPISL